MKTLLMLAFYAFLFCRIYALVYRAFYGDETAHDAESPADAPEALQEEPAPLYRTETVPAQPLSRTA